MIEEIRRQQIELCHKYRAPYEPLDFKLSLGVSSNLFSFDRPINGLRHPAEGNTSGWYLWAGELSDAADFFHPLHAHHLFEEHPKWLRFLGLPAGWRFLLADDYEDVWYDANLLLV